MLTASKEIIGDTTEAFGANPSDLDKIYKFKYKVIDIRDVIPSHTDTLKPNPDYPKELQPRVRDRAASKIQIDNMAKNLNPRVLLTDSGFLDTGPMIVGPDNVVESGNGRMLALLQAVNDKSSRYRLYKNMLLASAEKYGIRPKEIERIDNPVLVRVRESKVNRVEFAREANQGNVLSMSPFEQALVDSQRLKDSIINTIEVGEGQTIDQALKSRRNDHIVTHFLQTVPENERANLADSKGGINQAGINRLKTAIFAKTYPGEAGERLTRTFSESVEPNIRTIENAMFQTLPDMAKAESLVSTGKRDDNLSMSKDLAAAIDAFARIREADKLTVADYLQQKSMFGDELTPLQKQLLQHFDTMGSKSKMVREFLRESANKIIDAPTKGQSAMFGADTVPTKEEMLNAIINRQREELGKVPVATASPESKKLERSATGGNRSPGKVGSRVRKSEARKIKPDTEGPKRTRFTANELNHILSTGGTVQVTTATKSWLYTHKHAGMFVEKNGDLYVKTGKGLDKLSMGSGLLVAIRTTGGAVQPTPEPKPEEKTKKPRASRKREHEDDAQDKWAESPATGYKEPHRGSGIQSKGVINAYYRPVLIKLEKTAAEGIIKDTEAQQIDRNMWKLGTERSKRLPSVFDTKLILRRNGNYYEVSIPTDIHGDIPQLIMAERLLDEKDGSRPGKERNVWIDCSTDALKSYDATDQAKTYHWFLYPNETDVKFIDDSRTKIVEFLDQGAGKGKGKKIRALVVGGSAIQRADVVDNLRHNFTAYEKRIINNFVIEIIDDNEEFAGAFQSNMDKQGNLVNVPVLYITKRFTKNPDALVHEAVHALRQFDPKRHPKLKHVKEYKGKDADLEESLTEAEAIGRETPFKRGQPGVLGGYYHKITIGNKKAHELITEDRVTITGSVEKGKKGKTVQKAVVLKYPATNISHLKIQGPTEAIDTFYEIERSLPGPTPKGKPVTTEMHFFNPKGNEKTDAAMDQRLKSETTGKITQFHDGKPETIRRALKLAKPVTKLPKHLKDQKTRPARRTSRRFGPYTYAGGTLRR